MTEENTEVLDDQSASFDERLMEALEDDSIEETPEVQPDESAEIIEEQAQAHDPLEAPEYFSSEHKEYFKKLQEIENGRDIAEKWLDQYQETQKYITQKSQKLADERRQNEQQLQEFNQYQQALQPINEIWQRQGITPAMGVAQMAYYGQLLHTDPKKLIEEVANFAGLDLNQVVEEQPYIEPHIQEQLKTLQQQNQQLQQFTAQQQQQAQAQQQQAINEQINSFISEPDDKGQPLRPFVQNDNPHQQAVLQYMAAEMTKQFYPAKDMDEAYQRAINGLPDVQKEVAKMQESEQAKARRQEVEKAKQASTKVNSKTKDAPEAKKSFDERLWDQLEGV